MASISKVNQTLDAFETLTTVYENQSGPHMKDALDFVISVQDRNYRSGAVVIVGVSDNFVNEAVQSSKYLQNMGYHVFTVALQSQGDFAVLASDESSAYIIHNPKLFSSAAQVAENISSLLLTRSSICVPLATKLPPTYTTSRTAATAGNQGSGSVKYEGDIAIVYELTLNDTLNGNFDMIRKFLTDYLLSPQNNAYELADGTTRLLLAPYPSTNAYGLTNYYKNDLTSIRFLNRSLLSIESLTKPLGIVAGAHMKDGLDLVLTSPDHGPRFGAVVIVGISDEFVNEAVSSSEHLQNMGYHVFTVTLKSQGSFSALASDKGSNYNIVDPREVSEVSSVAEKIASFLLSKSSICLSPPCSSQVATSKVYTTPTLSPPTTCYGATYQYLTQDIAFVWELSTSTGDTTVSNFTSTFLSNYLIPMSMRNLKDPKSPWSSLSNVSVIPFPSPDNYLRYGDFGKIHSGFLSGLFSVFWLYSSTMDITRSDINSGLAYANNEFKSLTSHRPQTVVLFANSAAGVNEAQAVATKMKQNEISIVTVSVTCSTTFDLSPLASDPSFVHFIDSRKPASQQITEILNTLAQIGSRCCDNPGCV